jgi:hypothetical protein
MNERMKVGRQGRRDGIGIVLVSQQQDRRIDIRDTTSEKLATSFD